MSLLRALIGCLLLPLLLACTGPAPASGPAPEVVRLQEAGFALPDDTEIAEVAVVIIEGQDYRLLGYRSLAGDGIQIEREGIIVSDPALARSVLLAHAASEEARALTADDITQLHALHAQLAGAEQEFAALFALAIALEPLLATIEELKGIPIHGVPTVSVKGFDLLAVRNAWDLLCSLPVNAADLCLLEIPLQALHDQAVEIQQLLKESEQDTEQLLALLEATRNGQPVDGIALRAALHKANSSLLNLQQKLINFAETVVTLQAVIGEARARLASPDQWNPQLRDLLGLLQGLVPELDPGQGAARLVAQLDELDQELASYVETSAEQFEALAAHQQQLATLSGRIDTRLEALSEQWIARPLP